MKNTTHRVVILKNVNSDFISQAILILKDTANETESTLLFEAEKIVEKYMGEHPEVFPEKKRVLSPLVIALTISAGVLGLAALSFFV